MKHAIRISTILAAAAFAACFGAGPEPSKPTNATIVFSVGPETTINGNCEWKYFGDVAWGSDVGYTTIVPYGPNDCSNGATQPNQPIDVFQFPKSGGAPMRIGSAGTTGMNLGPLNDPRVVLADGVGSGVLWTYVDPTTQQTAIDTIGTHPLVSNVVQNQVVAMHAAAGTIYLASQPGGGPAINYPGFPCCQDGQSNMQAAVTAIGSGTIPTNQVANCGYASHCFASNSHALFVFEPVTPPVDVRAIPLPGTGSSGSGQIVATVPQGPSFAPVGLAVDETNLVVATAAQLQSSGNSVFVGCLIQHFDLGTGTHETLIDTVKFSCMDPELDGTKVYFAIVDITQGDNNGGGNNNNTMHGDGIGRVDIGPGHAFESVALGFGGDGAGPRRLHIDGPTIFAVDPHVIGSLPKSALDNQHDFSTQ